jgi:hypothetical protein
VKKNDLLLTKASVLFLRMALTAIIVLTLLFCIFALPNAWQGVEKEYHVDLFAFYALILTFYAVAVPFLIALFQGYNLLSYIDKNKAFSNLTVKALQRIAYCAYTGAVLFTLSLPFFYVWAQRDDAPGLVIIGSMFVGGCLTVGVFANMLQRIFLNAIKMKSENDLTV